MTPADQGNPPEQVVKVESVKSEEHASPVTVQIKSHLWIDWAEVAIESEASARNARQETYPQDVSIGLRAEKHGGMVAVSACEHALDALYRELRDVITLPASLIQAWAAAGPARLSRILVTLKLGFALSKAQAKWPQRFEELFDRRKCCPPLS
jgi:hypothetical protein